jgi:hypothetical protein
MTAPTPHHRQRRSRPAVPLALPALAAAGALAAAVSLAACGSPQAGRAGGASRPAATSSRPATTPATRASTPAATISPVGGTSGTAVAPCQPAVVRVTLDTSATGVAAGSSFVALQFANQSGQSCELAGYPDVSFQAGAAGRMIGAAAAPDRGVAASQVLLASGGIAHAWLQVADTVSIPASQCDPVTADGLRVALPGAPGATYLAHRFAACAATISGTQILAIQPIQPGAARRGSAQ